MADADKDPDKDAAPGTETGADSDAGNDNEREQPEPEQQEPAEAERVEESESDEDPKQSLFRRFRLRELSGPQACLSIVGCGTLAAVLVVALVYGGIRLVAGSLTGDNADDAGDGALPPSGEPIEEVAPGQLDLCGRGIPSISGLSVERIDAQGDSYVDTAEESTGPDRHVSDECSWTLMPQEYTENPWVFDFSYHAILSVEDGDPGSMASEDFADVSTDLLAGYSSVDSEGPTDYGDESHYAYGETGDVLMYHVVVRERGAVYSIVFTSEDETSEHDFDVEARKILERVSIDLAAVLPN